VVLGPYAGLEVLDKVLVIAVGNVTADPRFMQLVPRLSADRISMTWRKLAIYVVDWDSEKVPLLGEGVVRAAAKLGIGPVKPITLLSVAALWEPDLLGEVEATAVIE
jgi:hypothetical protein